MSTYLDTLRARLDKAYDDLAAAQRASQVAENRADSHTISDPGALSGIRRRPDRKADDRRYNTYARAAEAQTRLDRARNDITRLQRMIEAAEAERDRVRLTLEDIKGTNAIRTTNGWHRVVRVNAKSVTVETGYSWTDRIPLEQVLEARVI